MVVGTLRNAQLVINQQAIFENVKNARQHTDEGTDLFVVLKANGYGHGAIQVARIAEKAGATGFCVALLDEALELRNAGFNEPILVLGITDPEFAAIARDHNISLTVSSTEWLKSAAITLKQVPSETLLNVHLALDTGMGRLGFQYADELKAAIQVLTDLNDVMNFEGIFTHFATADSQMTITLIISTIISIS